MRFRIAFGVATVLAIASVSANGQCVPTWQTMDGGYVNAERVYASVTWDPDGAGPAPAVLVVAGSFNHIGSVSCLNVAQWNGAAWQPLGGGLNDIVFALAVYNGELIACGFFTSAGGGPAYVARWNGASWQSLGAGTNAIVGVLAVYNGELIVGGHFTLAGGVACNRIARWNGSSWQALGTGLNSYVSAMTIDGSELVVGGGFTQAGGVSCGRLARWNGTTWLGTAATINSEARALAIYGGQLVVGGSVILTPNTPVTDLARWDGAAWQPFGGGPSGGLVSALRVENGDLIVGGDFAYADGIPTGPVARWDGAAWQIVGGGIPGYYAAAYTLTRYQGELFAGGNNFEFPSYPPQYITARLRYPVATVALSQQGGAGGGIMVSNAGMIPGHEYRNVASYELCGIPGSGPYGGLCITDLAFFSWQLAFPVGSHPFHFVATWQTLVVGPYSAGPGTYDMLCVDVTGGIVGCISPVVRFTIQ